LIKYSKLLIAILVLALTAGCKRETRIQFSHTIELAPQTTEAKVKRVIDGDTFELETGERVRLIGIDTPEKSDSDKLERDSEASKKDKEIIKKLGELCARYTRLELEGKTVTLKPDSTNDDKDVYGRLLRYVYLEDGTLFNHKIIKEGYAYAFTRYPFIHMEDFRLAEREAREERIGLWRDKDFKDLDTEN
jgi:micrococcal nuclease